MQVRERPRLDRNQSILQKSSSKCEHSLRLALSHVHVTGLDSTGQVGLIENMIGGHNQLRR